MVRYDRELLRWQERRELFFQLRRNREPGEPLPTPEELHLP